jgi:membrane associated rhomboid family serine protease
MIPLHDDNPTEITPYITIGFISICVLVFFWQLSLNQETLHLAIYSFGTIPALLFNVEPRPEEIAIVPVWATMFTSMFMHGGWMHLIGNMLYLWIFGNNVEDAMGHVRFIIFYFVCGIAAVMAQALPDTSSVVPMIGASGAISGVLGAYLLLYPHARVLVGIPFGFYLHTMKLPAGWVLVFWFVLQLVSSLMAGNQQGGVAFGAHIGGFVAGMMLVPLFKKKEFKLLSKARS